jgi:methyltransferase-like protein 6
VRQDGTRAYYFTVEEVAGLMQRHGFQSVQSTYVHKHTVNAKEGLDVPRIFVQGVFRRA